MNYECFRLVDKPYKSSVAVLTSGDFGFLFCIGSHVHSRREATSSGADIFDMSQNIAHVRACSRAAAAGHQAKVGTGFSEGRPSCVLGGFARWDCLGFKADNVRKQQQDYTWFLHYITPSMWKGMESLDGPNVLEKLCHHAALLGLRNPTEQSVATLLTISFDTHALFGFWEVVLDAAAQGLHQKAIGQRWKLHFAFASIAGKSRRITWGVTAACLPRPGGNFSRKLRERVLLKNSCSIDHQNDKTIADHQPLTTANDTANDKTIADHQPLTTANDLLRRSAEKICREDLLRKSAEKICWENLLRRFAEYRPPKW